MTPLLFYSELVLEETIAWISHLPPSSLCSFHSPVWGGKSKGSVKEQHCWPSAELEGKVPGRLSILCIYSTHWKHSLAAAMNSIQPSPRTLQRAFRGQRYLPGLPWTPAAPPPSQKSLFGGIHPSGTCAEGRLRSQEPRSSSGHGRQKGGKRQRIHLRCEWGGRSRAGNTRGQGGFP